MNRGAWMIVRGTRATVRQSRCLDKQVLLSSESGLQPASHRPANTSSRLAASRILSAQRSSSSELASCCFLGQPGLRGLVVCLSAEDGWWPDLPCASDPRITRAEGGRERADSVLNGLNKLASLDAADEDWVLVHDAARPNLAETDLHKLLYELGQDPIGGLLAVPVRDTLKIVGADGRVTSTPDRSLFWQAYTPQMFRLAALRRALSDALAAGATITDEASAMEWAGHAPRSRFSLGGSSSISTTSMVAARSKCSSRNPALLNIAEHAPAFLLVVGA